MLEDGPHTDATKGSIPDRTRDDLIAFPATGVDVRLERREAVFVVEWARLVQTPLYSSLCVVALRVLCLRRL